MFLNIQSDLPNTHKDHISLSFYFYLKFLNNSVLLKEFVELQTSIFLKITHLN